MEIIVAKRAGFCFGVKRAIDIAFGIAEKKQEGIYTFGPIIHNPQVIEKLRAKGIVPTDDIRRDNIKALIIRTHGMPLNLMERASKAGYDIIDATCPFVKKAQHYAKLLREEGYQVVILGDREHPEVKGLMSYAGEDVVVVNSGEELPDIKKKVGIVVQTTQPVEELKKLIGAVIGQSKEVKVYNTICNSTALRLRETEEMAKKVDVMIVVGGKNSANTTQLANLCKSMRIKTYHIETADEIKEAWFEGIERVGVTAGASTPDWIIRGVAERIKDIGGIQGDGT
ncbi:MAG: 4-hydroxy-3-methylbut-2-enyl diphosphate reductase [Thermodesulfovibrionales bacterium]